MQILTEETIDNLTLLLSKEIPINLNNIKKTSKGYIHIYSEDGNIQIIFRENTRDIYLMWKECWYKCSSGRDFPEDFYLAWGGHNDHKKIRFSVKGINPTKDKIVRKFFALQKQIEKNIKIFKYQMIIDKNINHLQNNQSEYFRVKRFIEEKVNGDEQLLFTLTQNGLGNPLVYLGGSLLSLLLNLQYYKKPPFVIPEDIAKYICFPYHPELKSLIINYDEIVNSYLKQVLAE